VTVRVEPTLHRNAAGLGPWIDSAVSPSLVVQRPARAPDAIPQPPTEAQLKAARKRREESESSTKLMSKRTKVVLAVIAVVIVIGVTALVIADPGRWGAGVARTACIVAVVSVVGAWQTRRGKG
jgi:hypothetical protein